MDIPFLDTTVDDIIRPQNPQPSVRGDGTRWRAIQPGRTAVFTRNIIKWLVPEVGIVEMYINPQSIKYVQRKDIKETRTKGGYVSNYWGEELMTLSISGTTGTSGIEGINVLEDVYRAEQMAFDPYALAMAAQRDKEAQDEWSFMGDLGGLMNDVNGMISNALNTGSPVNTRSTPTLADLAFSVEMYYSGWTFRGYFTDFSVTESADNIGMFNYDMNFKVTQRRGVRTNFFGWHRSATNGPSDSDPNYGVPHSYSGLSNTRINNIPPEQRSGTTINEALEWAGRGIADVTGDIFGGIF